MTFSRCAGSHGAGAICFRCAMPGEGPAWWETVPGYGSLRPEPQIESRWTHIGLLLGNMTREEIGELPLAAGIRAKAYAELFEGKGR